MKLNFSQRIQKFIYGSQKLTCPTCAKKFLTSPSSKTVLRQDTTSASSGTILRQNQAPTTTGTVLRQDAATSGTVLRQNKTPTATGTALRQEPAAPPPKPTAASDAISWQLGATVLDEFRIEKMLGRGGMGEVYLVVDLHNEQHFAVKRIYSSQARHQDLFWRELQVWLDLPPYPHILPLRFSRTVGDEQLIFTDYMPGGSVESWLGTPKLGTLETVLDLAIQYAWGLHTLHELGHVHQDVKPENALLDAYGILKVADFGLTQAAGAGFTPTYCSPEQFCNQELTSHTDQWSWGLSVLAMFVGKNPVTAGQNAAAALEQFRNTPKQLALSLPAPVTAVLARCFQDRPEARWSSLLEAAKTLVELYPKLCGGQPYPRCQPTFIDVSERPKMVHDRLGISAHWQNPRTWLLAILRSANIDLAEAQSLKHVQVSSRKAQAANDLAVYDEAYKILDKLVRSGRYKLQRYLSVLCMEKALIYGYLMDISGQVQMLDKAINILRESVESARKQNQNRKRDIWDFEKDLSTALSDKSIAQKVARKLPEAIELLNESIEIQVQLITRAKDQNEQESLQLDPNILIDNQYFLAQDYYNRAITAADLTDIKGSSYTYDKIIEFFDQAIASFARIMEDQHHRALVEPKYAITLMGKGTVTKNMIESESFCDQAVAILKRHVDEMGRLDLRSNLAIAYMNSGITASNTKNFSKAKLQFEQAITIYRELVNKDGRENLNTELAKSLINQALMFNLTEEPSYAIGPREEAISILEPLVKNANRRELIEQWVRAVLAQMTTFMQLNKGEHYQPKVLDAITTLEQEFKRTGSPHLKQMADQAREHFLSIDSFESDLQLTDLSWRKSVLLTALLQLSTNQARVKLLKDKSFEWTRSRVLEKKCLGMSTLRYLHKMKCLTPTEMNDLMQELQTIFVNGDSVSVKFAALECLGGIGGPNPLDAVQDHIHKKIVDFRSQLMQKMQASQRDYLANGLQAEMSSEMTRASYDYDRALKNIISYVDDLAR